MMYSRRFTIQELNSLKWSINVTYFQMNGLICIYGARYDVRPDNCLMLRSIIGEHDHFEVPAAFLSGKGDCCPVIGISLNKYKGFANII